jgi:hypothetical protein
MMAQALALAEPMPMLRAVVRGRRITCAGVTLHPLRHPVLVLCRLLAQSDLEDCALSVSYDGEKPSLLVGSFRDMARWEPRGKKWVRV